MTTYISFLVTPILVIVFYQFYAFTASRKGVEKQNKCQQLGIFYTSLGTVLLVCRELAEVITGLILIMMGLRLIAHGLDRLDKKIYIDHYADDDLDASAGEKERPHFPREKGPVTASEKTLSTYPGLHPSESGSDSYSAQ